MKKNGKLKKKLKNHVNKIKLKKQKIKKIKNRKKIENKKKY